MKLTSLTFSVLQNDSELSDFDSNDEDINEFLKQDAFDYQNKRMANTYLFLDKKNKVQAFFSILNDCLNDKGYTNADWNRFHRRNSIPNSKRLRQYPAIKIGRLGVDKKHQGTGLAYELMDFIKGYSVLDIKPACRLLILDAYNKSKQLGYYKRNGFDFLLENDKDDKTRLMYFDLIQFGD